MSARMIAWGLLGAGLRCAGDGLLGSDAWGHRMLGWCVLCKPHTTSGEALHEPADAWPRGDRWLQCCAARIRSYYNTCHVGRLLHVQFAGWPCAFSAACCTGLCLGHDLVAVHSCGFCGQLSYIALLGVHMTRAMAGEYGAFGSLMVLVGKVGHACRWLLTVVFCHGWRGRGRVQEHACATAWSPLWACIQAQSTLVELICSCCRMLVLQDATCLCTAGSVHSYYVCISRKFVQAGREDGHCFLRFDQQRAMAGIARTELGLHAIA